MHTLLPVLALLCAAAEPVPVPRIRATTDAVHVVVTAALSANLPEGRLTQEQGEQYLRLCLVRADGKDGPAILGVYERRGAVLHFTPRHALSHGQRYRATLELGKQSTSAAYTVPPRPPSPPAVVERVYPSAAELPANNLKFYLHFSKPMREGEEIFDQVALLDEQGKPIPAPWRRTELWSEDGKRLTLWIHPGRVKEGVNLREEIGPVLTPGRRYTLVVSADLRDAEGQALGKPFMKTFRTGEPQRGLVRLADWKAEAPDAGSRQPLVLRLSRPLDRHLLERFVTVVDASGKPLPGRIEVGAEERSLHFHPERPWQTGTHTVRVDGRLEDLAGNTPARVFDRKVDEVDPQAPQLSLTFEPRAAKR